MGSASVEFVHRSGRHGINRTKVHVFLTHFLAQFVQLSDAAYLAELAPVPTSQVGTCVPQGTRNGSPQQ